MKLDKEMVELDSYLNPYGKGVIIRFLSIELTQRCQLNCKHCCVGKQREVDLDLDKIEAFFSNKHIKGAKISTIGLTGGEPLLNLDAIRFILNQLKKNTISVGKFLIRTNGIAFDDEAAKVLSDLFNYSRDGKYNNTFFPSGLVLSLDNYHKLIDKDQLDKFMSYPFSGVEIANNEIDNNTKQSEQKLKGYYDYLANRYGESKVSFNSMNLFVRGNAVDLFEKISQTYDSDCVLKPVKERTDNEILSREDSIVFSLDELKFIHICCDGKITTTCDLLNDYSDRDKYIIGDVSNENWLEEAIKNGRVDFYGDAGNIK